MQGRHARAVLRHRRGAVPAAPQLAVEGAGALPRLGLDDHPVRKPQHPPAVTGAGEPQELGVDRAAGGSAVIRGGQQQRRAAVAGDEHRHERGREPRGARNAGVGQQLGRIRHRVVVESVGGRVERDRHALLDRRGAGAARLDLEKGPARVEVAARTHLEAAAPTVHSTEIAVETGGVEVLRGVAQRALAVEVEHTRAGGQGIDDAGEVAQRHEVFAVDAGLQLGLGVQSREVDRVEQAQRLEGVVGVVGAHRPSPSV